MVLILVLVPLVSIIKDTFESLTLNRRKKGWSGTCGRRLGRLTVGKCVFTSVPCGFDCFERGDDEMDATT